MYGRLLFKLNGIDKRTRENFSGDKNESMDVVFISLTMTRISIYKLKCHKIGTNELLKDKQVVKKVPYLFLDLEMHKLMYN